MQVLRKRRVIKKHETQERLKKEQQEMQQDEVLIAQIESEESV